jgi:hypothetical protein
MSSENVEIAVVVVAVRISGRGRASGQPGT